MLATSNSTFLLPAQSSTLINNRFFEEIERLGGGLNFISDHFRKHFRGLHEYPTEEISIGFHVISEDRDWPHVGPKIVMTLTQLLAILKLQANGEEGLLLVDGRANSFHIYGHDELMAVNVSWNDSSWGLWTFPSEFLGEWACGDEKSVGGRVFYRL